jgi:hypothetical protein
MVKTKRQAMAYHYCMDIAETEDNRYHYGRTTQPVWAFNSFYCCVTKETQRPAKHRDGMAWDWEQVGEVDGFKIWEAKV